MKFVIVNTEGKYWSKPDHWTFDIRQAYEYATASATQFAVLDPNTEYVGMWDGERLWKLTEMQKQRTCKCGTVYIVETSYPVAVNSPNSPICSDCEDKITNQLAAMNTPAERD